MDELKRKQNEDVLAGCNCVREALRAGRPIDTLLIARGERSGGAGAVIAMCREKGIPVKEVAPAKLEALCGTKHHRGVAAVAAAHEYASVEDLFAAAEAKGEAPFFIIADGLEDPHNLGAVIRTAEAAGAHGVIVPKRRSSGLTVTVARSAAGALAHLPVARVANLASAIDDLKQRGVWIYAADMDGSPWCETDFSGAVGLVVGSEGEGVSRLVREKSDFILSLPMRGKISSLNASVAAGIVMYEVARQRLGLKAK